MNKLPQEEQDLKDFLTAHGFTVERLETQQGARTCDFEVAGGVLRGSPGSLTTTSLHASPYRSSPDSFSAC
jgi:hypothetical protein